MTRYLALALLLTSSFCAAQPTCEQLVPQALEAYGVNDSLKSFPAQMQAQMNAQMSQNSSFSGEDRQKLADSIAKGMSVDRLTKNVQQSLIASCNAQEVKTVLDQLSSPLVQKMRVLEGASSSPEAAENLRRAFDLPEVQNPPEKRAVLIRRLVNTTGAADAMAETIVETSRALSEGMGAPPPSADQLSGMRKQIESTSHEQMRKMMLAVYHDATDEELEKYITMQASKPFQDFNKNLSNAMVKGFAEESRHAGEELRKTLDAIRAQRPPSSN